MYGQRTTIDLHRPPEGNDVYARLNWLLAANAQEAYHRSLFRHQSEEEQMLLMRRPMNARRAYALFGLMLGLLPPAAIFIRIFEYGVGTHNSSILLFIACLLMNLVCAAMGYFMGGALSPSIERLERASRTRMALVLPFVGAAWGTITGGTGGFVFVGIGAYFGIVFAIPIAALAFPLFALLHRTVAQGGMIDARHFWPLASGVTFGMAALILGL